MPEDVMTQFMQMMRMMEYLREVRLRRAQEQNPVGVLAGMRGLREGFESVPAGPQREEAYAQFLRGRGTKEGTPQWEQSMQYLHTPSQRYIADKQRFMLTVEQAKQHAADLRQSTNRWRAWLQPQVKSGAISQEDADAFLIPEEEHLHTSLQGLMRTMTAAGLDLRYANPNDSDWDEITKDMEATMNIGPGAGAAFRSQQGGPPAGGGGQPPGIGPYRQGYGFTSGPMQSDDWRLQALNAPGP